jgi:hypothetical protein
MTTFEIVGRNRNIYFLDQRWWPCGLSIYGNLDIFNLSFPNFKNKIRNRPFNFTYVTSHQKWPPLHKLCREVATHADEHFMEVS